MPLLVVSGQAYTLPDHPQLTKEHHGPLDKLHTMRFQYPKHLLAPIKVVPLGLGEYPQLLKSI